MNILSQPQVIDDACLNNGTRSLTKHPITITNLKLINLLSSSEPGFRGKKSSQISSNNKQIPHHSLVYADMILNWIVLQSKKNIESRFLQTMFLFYTFWNCVSFVNYLAQVIAGKYIHFWHSILQWSLYKLLDTDKTYSTAMLIYKLC